MVGSGNFIMQGARISHDVTIGNNCIIGNGSQVSGCCVVEDYAILTSNVLMQGKTRLGAYAAVQGGCRFTKDIPPYCVAAHEPTAFYSINTTVLQHEGFSETVIKHIAHAFRILYKVNTSTEDALRRDSVNSSSISITDSLLNTSKCTLSFVFGAAIKNSSVTGSPSSESKSTPFLMTIAARPGLLTASHFPCGIAIPSPIPVVLSSSLA